MVDRLSTEAVPPMRQIDLVKLYSQKRCLIIDDMPDVRVALVNMLKSFGVTQLDVVANGEQAVEACFANQYQLVICDYNLGNGRDGQQVLEELRYRNKLNNTSIFVMVTAESSREMVLGALEYQPDDYVTKPITQQLLKQRLDRVLVRHRELYTIKQALDERDYQLAESRCVDALNRGTGYRSACLQIQAEMNLRLFNFQKAEDIYRDALTERPVLWAKLGLGKTLVAKKNYMNAETNLKEVIEADKRIVEAQDLLADAYLGQGETILAQSMMQSAAEVSPKSIFRQRRLAQIAKLNEDAQVCLEACRRAIKIARNSCHESADDYFALASELAELSKDTTEDSESYVKETFEVLQRLEKRPYFDVSADVLSNSLRSRSLMNNKKISEAKVFFDKAKSVFDDKKDELKPQVGLDFVKTLIVKGDKQAAEELLKDLAERYADNESVVAKVDALSSTPKSQGGRKKVADMTKSGIELYEAKKYADAINLFKNAISVFPSHIGLNLNLIQATIAETKENGEKLGFEKLCKTSLRRISEIDPNDSQYPRYQYLKQQIEQLFSNQSY